MNNLDRFKVEIEPYLKGYEIKFKYFEKGDFGSLTEIEFNCKDRGGVIDIWGMGWLGVHFVDYLTSEEKINVMLDPLQVEEMEHVFWKLNELL